MLIFMLNNRKGILYKWTASIGVFAKFVENYIAHIFNKSILINYSFGCFKGITQSYVLV